MHSATLSNTEITDPATFNVAIIGGGIGGLTTALSVAYHSPTLQNITVYEQAPAYKEIGAGIGIGVNAARILKKLGVWQAANAISGERNGVHRSCRRYDTGEEIVAVGAMDENADGGVRQLSVHRAEILDVLYQELIRNYGGRVTLKTDMKATRVEDCGSEVAIYFANATNPMETANLVIACDGIHSTIRSQFALDKPRYSGRIAYRGLLPLSAISDKWPYPSYAVSWLAPDKHFLVFPISQNKTLNVVAFVTKPENELGDLKESWTSSAPRRELESEYAGWEPTVGAVIQEMEAWPGKWRLNDRELLEQWTYLNGKVVLAGDAAHAMLPHQGSGAGHAIEDAYILGLIVSDYFANPIPGLAAYTALYQAVRRPRAQKAQITSRQAGDVYEMQGKEFEGIASYEDGLPIVREKLAGRMKWVWGHDLEADYQKAREEAGLAAQTQPKVLPRTNGTVNGILAGTLNGNIGAAQHGIDVQEVEA
ncbi:uncharacterized protein Z519_07988 [Cladophialophora bantiana CBS 173.52]|uniref:FAD-binding domain-containing protein n=1 Tax=Cladophialophora bantiana (strain ATCC 10958 / CBS 173.52 / CDC B-1940 / NIH 8579) TaxID=1442370 RepID=A0A0D2I2K4_CLAB1|nr:uncharacterized protein Z519_07988 [Cladophialophora bantiana CBS 173.52]KIW91094.1 hypothetical protein Z519_07988 [Cladophialophora bantiana CBS 173.52]